MGTIVPFCDDTGARFLWGLRPSSVKLRSCVLQGSGCFSGLGFGVSGSGILG